MRILAIRGANLASLAAAFEIDLNAAPLADAGLFAITGDTGAGKSTILDALCLGLYGNYPRATDKRDEKVRDPSGDEIQASNPSNILRRGAGSGFAAVDFIGLDGIAYRASWEVRRARGRATGRFQNADRKLERCDGSAAIATGRTEVLAAVIARTGFTFDQFRRTVLLAQGEFDAFLLADEGARAELLEKITGTEIYGLISQRVYEEAERRRGSVAGLEQRRRDIGLMAPEAREALLSEQAATASSATTLGQHRDRLAGLINRAEAIDAARQALRLAEAMLATAREAYEAVAADRHQLEQLATIAPLRPRAERVAQAQTNLTTAEQAVGTARARLDAAEQALAAATADYQAKLATEQECAAEVQRHEPSWHRAMALDQQIASARTEHGTAEIHAGHAGVDAKTAKAALDDLVDKIAEVERLQAEIATQLEAAATHAPLALEAPRIAKLFNERIALASRLKVERDQLRLASDEAVRLGQRIKDCETRLVEARARRQQSLDQVVPRQGALDAIDETRLAERDEGLRRLQQPLLAAVAAARRHLDARSAEAEAYDQAATLAVEIAKGVARVSAAEAASREQDARRGEILALGELADAAMSNSSAALRSVLADGEPCPVCGATEHPFAASDDAHAKLATAIRQRRVELDARANAAVKELSAAKADEARLGAQLAVVRQAAVKAVASASAAADEFARLRSSFVAQLDALALRHCVTAQLDSASIEALGSTAEQVVRERTAVEAPLRSARTLRAEIDQLRRQLGKQDLIIDAAGREHAADLMQLHAAQTLQARHETAASGLLVQIERATADIVPILAHAGLDAVDLERDAAATARRVAQLGKTYQALLGNSGAHVAMLSELRPLHSVAASRREASAEARAAALNAVATRASALTALADDRDLLLGGEPTATHRTRFMSALANARVDLETSRNSQSAAAGKRAEAHAHHAAAVKAALDAATAHSQASRDLAAALGSIGMTSLAAEALLAVDADTQAALRNRIESLRRSVEDADATGKIRDRDLGQLIADTPAACDLDISAARSEQAALHQQLDLASRRLGEITVLIDGDDNARSTARALAEEIASAVADLKVWQEVNLAIGQRDGAKFRRFAQGVTFGQLVRLANDQLAGLNPRYALARGAATDLALDVIDRDMGDEVRNPRSLSGGERFLVSLALALALSGLEGRQSFVDTLFIDEGFGSLDRETLDMAIDALESLQGHGRKVGVITHVQAMIERIALQVRVEKRGNGRSVVQLIDSGRIVASSS